jgi:hypothetical protein
MFGLDLTLPGPGGGGSRPRGRARPVGEHRGEAQRVAVHMARGLPVVRLERGMSTRPHEARSRAVGADVEVHGPYTRVVGPDGERAQPREEYGAGDRFFYELVEVAPGVAHVHRVTG